MDVDSGVCHANLSTVPLDTVLCLLYCLLDVGIWEDDGWGFTTQLKNHILQIRLGCCGLDDATSSSRAREAQDADIHVVGQDVAGDVAMARNDVDNTRGEAGFLHKAGDFGTLLTLSARSPCKTCDEAFSPSMEPSHYS